jgi:hypothetical protein
VKKMVVDYTNRLSRNSWKLRILLALRVHVIPPVDLKQLPTPKVSIYMSTEPYVNCTWTVIVNRLVPQSVKMRKTTMVLSHYHDGHMSTIKDVSRHAGTNIRV